MSQEVIFANLMINSYLSIDNEKIKNYCYWKKNNSGGRSMTNVGGWQSDDIELQHPDLQELVIEVGKAFSEIFALHSLDEGNIKVANSWVNINPKNSYNLSHNHVGSLFSAVYYVQAEENMGSIVFENPCPTIGHHLSFFKFKKRTPANSETWSLEPSTGQLIVFPSWLNHHVLPNMTDKDRISIAINSFMIQEKD